MISKQDLSILSGFIEENTRTSVTSGITYIDPRNHKDRILLKQNHVIFGRRGAGKSSLIKTLSEKDDEKYYYSYTNLEDFKDISFPNIIIHVLDSFYTQIIEQIKNEYSFYEIKKMYKAHKLIRGLDKSFSSFKDIISNPDNYDEEIREKQQQSAELSTGLKKSPVYISVQDKTYNEIEIAKRINRDKLESIKNAIPQLKACLNNINDFSNNKSIFIIFDDFYFLKKSMQIFFIDFFHRLTKDTNLYLKVATIKHRTRLYAQIEKSFYGTEIGHDIHEIDLDYNLDRFDELKNFMKQLLTKCAELSNIEFVIDELLTDNAFSQLCLASGGVPRDFLTLFIKIISKYNPESGKRISKGDIIEAAILNMPNKYLSLKTDSAEEKELLETYLIEIKKQILDQKKTNMFLVSNSIIDNHPECKQAIKELVDLRMIHLVEPNTSSAGGRSSGQRFAAYILDSGLYQSASPIGFKQVEPGVADNEGRKDEMRGAPQLNIGEIIKIVESRNFNTKLEITDD